MRSTQIITFLLLGLALVGCRKKGPTQAERIKAFIGDGWTQFEAGKFGTAAIEFSDALELDTTSLEAKLGKGWSLLLIDNDAGEAPERYIDSTVTASATLREDAWVALAVSALSGGQYAEADSLATLVLTGSASYVFTHRESVDWQDLLIIQGESRFARALYATSWVAVEPLVAQTPFAAVVVSDTTTWLNDGETYNYFPEILAVILSYLSELFRVT